VGLGDGVCLLIEFLIVSCRPEESVLVTVKSKQDKDSSRKVEKGHQQMVSELGDNGNIGTRKEGEGQMQGSRGGAEEGGKNPGVKAKNVGPSRDSASRTVFQRDSAPPRIGEKNVMSTESTKVQSSFPDSLALQAGNIE